MKGNHRVCSMMLLRFITLFSFFPSWQGKTEIAELRGNTSNFVRNCQASERGCITVQFHQQQEHVPDALPLPGLSVPLRFCLTLPSGLLILALQFRSLWSIQSNLLPIVKMDFLFYYCWVVTLFIYSRYKSFITHTHTHTHVNIYR
jgi:hypothetical protein